MCVLENKKIIGIGTDIVNISRIDELYLEYADAFLYKNYHEHEINIFYDLPHVKNPGYLAKRFAAKEAIAKAFGTGIGKDLAFKDIAILNDEQGAPYVIIDSKKSAKFSKYNIHITMADDHPFAVAFAIITM